MSVLISLRVSEDTLNLIDDAAAAAGKNRTEFMLDTTRQRAIDVLLDQRLFVLNPDQYDAFVKALDNPKPPSDKFIAFMKGKSKWEK
jgi:uncharacterized protein (DUF1778 family)